MTDVTAIDDYIIEASIDDYMIESMTTTKKIFESREMVVVLKLHSVPNPEKLFIELRHIINRKTQTVNITAQV